MNSVFRTDRSEDDFRPIVFKTGVNAYAEGSVLIQTGGTHVLVTASVEEKVPKWLEGKGSGWVSAEYAMLPRSTHTRSRRERGKVSGRSQEIQRLIGRVLRNCVDFSLLGEKTIWIDCDVLQADGGTRTAAINGGAVALALAIKKLVIEKKVLPSVWKGLVSAMSLGFHKGKLLVDLDYQEDSTCDVDMNIAMTEKGAFVELQGTAERKPLSRENLFLLLEKAQKSCEQILKKQKAVLGDFLKTNL